VPISHNRILSLLIDALGGDPTGFSPTLLDTIQPVYVFDDATRGLPERAVTRAYINPIPSTAAAELSSFNFTPGPSGCWIRRAVALSGSNMGFAFVSNIGAYITTHDSLVGVPITYSVPENVSFNSIASVISLVTLDATPTSGSPRFFNHFDQGHGVATVANLVFTPVNAARDFLRDVWMAPTTSLVVQGVTVNTTISVSIEFDFPTISTYP
jgi:hypothetical protein